MAEDVLGRRPLDPSAFAGAEPYPHAVIDDFLPKDVVEAVLAEFPKDSQHWRYWHHYNERKRGITMLSEMGPATRRLVEDLHGEPFRSWLSSLSGIDGLIPDPDLEGGGLQETRAGGFLNIHADFLSHTRRPTWSRQLNVILYLNKDWREDWGGSLELWDRGMRRCVRRVAPVFNRCVIFQTTRVALHGYPAPLTCPEERSRKSLALYYYRDEGTVQPLRSTRYLPTPDDGLLRRALIRLDRALLGGYTWLKRRSLISDGSVARLLERWR